MIGAPVPSWGLEAAGPAPSWERPELGPCVLGPPCLGSALVSWGWLSTRAWPPRLNPAESWNGSRCVLRIARVPKIPERRGQPPWAAQGALSNLLTTNSYLPLFSSRSWRQSLNQLTLLMNAPSESRSCVASCVSSR